MTKEDHDKTNKATKNKTKLKTKQNKNKTKPKKPHNKYQTRVVNGRPRFFLLLVTVIVH
jgi:hypothetical protein